MNRILSFKNHLVNGDDMRYICDLLPISDYFKQRRNFDEYIFQGCEPIDFNIELLNKLSSEYIIEIGWDNIQIDND